MVYIKRKKRHLKRKYKLLIVILIIAIIIPLIITKAKYKDCINIENNETAIKKLDYTEESVFPNNVYGVPVETEIIPEGVSRPTTKRLIKYIVIHETDNFEAGVGARNHATYLKNNNESPTSWHYTVDDHEIFHHIPDNEIAHHAGDKEGNTYGIGIELCVNKDGDFNKTFDNGAKLVAYLLKAYDLDIDAIKTHHDFTGKDCPNNILKNKRLDEFKNRVREYLSE